MYLLAKFILTKIREDKESGAAYHDCVDMAPVAGSVRDSPYALCIMWAGIKGRRPLIWLEISPMSIIAI